MIFASRSSPSVDSSSSRSRAREREREFAIESPIVVAIESRLYQHSVVIDNKVKWTYIKIYNAARSRCCKGSRNYAANGSLYLTRGVKERWNKSHNCAATAIQQRCTKESA